MTTFTPHNPRITVEQHRISLNDRVSVPNGRVGRVIGFYCRDSETVLVRFDLGDSREYSAADLVLTAPAQLRPALMQREALQRFADRFGTSVRSRSARWSNA
jgi:hypothetical protein